MATLNSLQKKQNERDAFHDGQLGYPQTEANQQKHGNSLKEGQRGYPQQQSSKNGKRNSSKGASVATPEPTGKHKFAHQKQKK